MSVLRLKDLTRYRSGEQAGQHLSGLVDQLKNEAAPVEGLRRWLRSAVEFVATKKGMVAALALAVARLLGAPRPCTRTTDERCCRSAGSVRRCWRDTLRYPT
jgi:hypothetical protein